MPRPSRGTDTSMRAANLLGALSLAVSDRLAAVAQETAGSVTRSAALTLLGQVPGSSIEWLSRKLSLSHSATVRLVDGLEGAGLVTRGPGRDARTTALTLSAEGRRTAGRVRRARLRSLHEITEAMTAAERRALVRASETLLYRSVDGIDNAWRTCRLCHTSVCIDPTCPVLDAVAGILDDEEVR